MTAFFLERIRKIIKSIGKLEFNLIDQITLKDNSNNLDNKKVLLKDDHFEKIAHEINSNKNLPRKLAIVVCFYFNSKKLKILKKTLDNLTKLNFKKNITVLTNRLNINQKKIIKKMIGIKKLNCNLQEIKNLPEDNLLPWYSLNLMRNKIKDKTNSHFMFIEDDILVNMNNIKYWLYFRKILKKNHLIPGFIRYEEFKDKKFSVDNPQKINLKKLPKLETESKKNGFVNSKFPYHAMYLMDRKLMKNYLSSNAVNLDFSFTNKFMKSTYPMKELANISHAYVKIPKGYHNNFMIPFCDGKRIPSYCLIQHIEKKYTNFRKLNKIGYGTIEIKNLIIKN